MRLWDNLWAGVLVALVMGVILIGGGAYYWAWQEQIKRERERQWNEQVTGVKLPPPAPEEAERDWQRDLATGAAVGGLIWLLGAVAVFWGAWENRRAAVDGPPAEPDATADGSA